MRTINIFKFPLLVFFLCLSALAAIGNNKRFKDATNQQMELSGTVSDGVTGEPLIGVSVSIKGTYTGTITGATGEFSLFAPDSGIVLVFSYIGYVSEEIKVGNQTKFIVLLEPDLVNLDEVVVIGYGVQKKSDITGAISSIDSEDFESFPVSNPTTAMQGRAAGVQIVQNSGSPGASLSVKIRGTGTVNNSDPLYVVDGFIVENIDFLNPDDIKDIQILKDASSSAIYGARAANGVVLVTTKRGQSGKLNIRLNTYWGVSDFWKKPDMMDKYEYMAMYDSSSGGNQLLSSTRDSILFNEHSAENWLDHISRSGHTSKYSIQISGGNEKIRYFFSGALHNETGIIKKSSLEKRSARMNIESELSKVFTLKGNVSLTSSDRSKITESSLSEDANDDNNVFQSTINTPPTNRLHPDAAYIWDGNILVNINDALTWNPYTRVWYQDLNDKINQYVGNIELETSLGSSLVNVTRAGVDIQNGKYIDFKKRYDPAIYEFYNNINYDDNTFRKENMNRTKWQFENIITYLKIIGQHNINIVAAFALEGYSLENLSGKKSMAPGYTSNYQSLDAAFLNPITEGPGKSWKSMGIPFRLNYNYADKYYLQMNFRADASSIFKSENRWGYFPSVSVGWTVTNEPFMATFDWLSRLKIRANWGTLGNNRIDEYASNTIIETKINNIAVNGRNPVYRAGWSASGEGNPDILWEKTTATNIGVDFGFLNNSLIASIDVFDRKTSDMLLRLPIVLSSGMTDYPWQNAGEVSNKGFEGVLSFRKSIGKFSFDMSGNYTKINNKVTRLGDEGNPIWGGYFDENSAMLKTTYTTYTAVGKPIGMFYGYKIDRTKYENGLWHEQDRDIIPLSAVLNPVSTKPGDVIFMDLNGDNKIDENDKTFIGNPHPDFTYGFTLKFNYSGIDLIMFFQGVYGNDILNVERYYMYGFHGDNNALSGLVENSYTRDNEDAPYTALTNQTDYNLNYRISDFYIEDGSYFRLKNLQIGYNFPKKLLEKVKMQGMRIYFGGYNLLTLTKYEGFDPEIGSESNLFMGVDKGSYPQARTYMCGLVLDF